MDGWTGRECGVYDHHALDLLSQFDFKYDQRSSSMFIIARAGGFETHGQCGHERVRGSEIGDG